MLPQLLHQRVLFYSSLFSKAFLWQNPVHLLFIVDFHFNQLSVHWCSAVLPVLSSGRWGVSTLSRYIGIVMFPPSSSGGIGSNL